MLKTEKILLAGMALFLVSCSDISQICRHNGYLSQFLRFRAQREAAMPVSTVDVESLRSDAAAGQTSGKHETATDFRNEENAEIVVASASKTATPFQDTTVRTISWKQLSDVIFDKKFDEKLQMPMLYPSFSRNIKALHGKMITISGYVIPLDVKGGMYVLSANPNNSCFFCGGAGPESIMALKFKTGKPTFQTDDFVKCKGRLRLNEKNIYELYYNLDEVVLVGK